LQWNWSDKGEEGEEKRMTENECYRNTFHLCKNMAQHSTLKVIC
jgi:hypothetical protein